MTHTQVSLSGKYKPFWIDACVFIFIKVNVRREEISTFCENLLKFYSLTNFCLCLNNINYGLITTKLMEIHVCGILLIFMGEKTCVPYTQHQMIIR